MTDRSHRPTDAPTAAAPAGPPAAGAGAELALRLGFGALLLVAAAWLFGAIAEDVVTADRLTVLDAQVADWLHAPRDAGADARDARLVTDLHSTLAVVVLRRDRRASRSPGARRWRAADDASSSRSAAAWRSTSLMKLAFHRARPVVRRSAADAGELQLPERPRRRQHD